MKRPKHITIELRPSICYRAYYQCPHCKTTFESGFNENTIRFICSQCKNEIIVDGYVKTK
jgi:DNA-directed RNA polymerase subunit RPC12/RpoP